MTFNQRATLRLGRQKNHHSPSTMTKSWKHAPYQSAC